MNKNKDINVLFYIPVLSVGGAERVVVDLVNTLVSKGVIVCLVSDLKSVSPNYDLNRSIQSIHLDSNSFYFFKLWRLFKILRPKKGYKVFSHLTHSNIQLLLIKGFLKFDLTLVEHSITSKYLRTLGIIKSTFFNVFIKSFYRFADSIICVSESGTNDLISHFGLKTSDVKTIYNPINFNKISTLASKNLDVGLISSVASRNYYVIVGRLVKYKGHVEVIQTLADHLRSKDLSLLIVGDGEYKNVIRSCIERHGLVNHVFILGSQTNPYNIIKNSIGLIHHSYFEGFGLVIVEASYLGLPVFCIEMDYSLEIKSILPEIRLFTNSAQLQTLISQNTAFYSIHKINYSNDKSHYEKFEPSYVGLSYLNYGH
jgi:glycosyltransferase involved in cell wall biosynthesis